MAIRPTHTFPMHVPRTNYNDFNFKQEQTILIPTKCNHKCTEEINLLPSRRFSDKMNFKNFFVKNENIAKFGLKYHRYLVQLLVFRILRCSF